MSRNLVDKLKAQGVEIPHPAHVIVAPDVDLTRIEPGAVLLPGTRLEGARTIVRRGARIATGGPTLVRNVGVGSNVELISGTLEDSVFLDGAVFGPAGYARKGTIFEEGASAAHATGVKQTILLPFVALGSDVNFCDVLLAGGGDAKNHSEVGSGCIHFNFTPFGPTGDKATPSRFGDVPRGVWLRERRIFVGGAGGVVGPVRIGFGTVLAAGSVYRQDRGENLIVYSESLPEKEAPFDPRVLKRLRGKLERNLEFVANLVALHRFYTEVRIRLAGSDLLQKALIELGLLNLEQAVAERIKQLERMATGLEESAAILARDSGEDDPEVLLQRHVARTLPECRQALADPLRAEEAADRVARGVLVEAVPRRGQNYLDWLEDLGPEVKDAGRKYLESVVAAYLQDPDGAGRLLRAAGARRGVPTEDRSG